MVHHKTLSIIIVTLGATLPNMLMAAAGTPAAGGAGESTSEAAAPVDDTVTALFSEIQTALLAATDPSATLPNTDDLVKKACATLSTAHATSSIHILADLKTLADKVTTWALAVPSILRAHDSPLPDFICLKNLTINVVGCLVNQINTREGTLLDKKFAISPDKKPKQDRDAAFIQFCEKMEAEWNG